MTPPPMIVAGPLSLPNWGARRGAQVPAALSTTAPRAKWRSYWHVVGDTDQFKTVW